MPAFEKVSFMWSSSKGLDHGCALCGTKMGDPSAVNTCFGVHAEPCPKYHPIMHVLQKSSSCKHCVTAREQHYRRHQEILRVFNQVASLQAALLESGSGRNKGNKRIGTDADESSSAKMESVPAGPSNDVSKTEDDRKCSRASKSRFLTRSVDPTDKPEDRATIHSQPQTPVKTLRMSALTPLSKSNKLPTKREKRLEKSEKKITDDMKKRVARIERIRSARKCLDTLSGSMAIAISINASTNVDKLAETIHGHTFAVLECDKTSMARREDFKLASYDELVGNENIFQPTLTGVGSESIAKVNRIICDLFKDFKVATVEPEDVRQWLERKDKIENAKALKPKVEELQGLILSDLRNWDTEQNEIRVRERSYWKYAGRTVWQRHAVNLEKWNWATGVLYDKGNEIDQSNLSEERSKDYNRQAKVKGEAAEAHTDPGQTEKNSEWFDESEENSVDKAKNGAKGSSECSEKALEFSSNNSNRPATPILLPTRASSRSSSRSTRIRSQSSGSSSGSVRTRRRSVPSPLPQRRVPSPHVHRRAKKKSGNSKQLQKVLRQLEQEKENAAAKDASDQLEREREAAAVKEASAQRSIQAAPTFAKAMIESQHNLVTMDIPKTLDQASDTAKQGRFSNPNVQIRSRQPQETQKSGSKGHDKHLSRGLKWGTAIHEIFHGDKALWTSPKAGNERSVVKFQGKRTLQEQIDRVANEVSPITKEGPYHVCADCGRRHLNEDYADEEDDVEDEEPLRILGQRQRKVRALSAHKSHASPAVHLDEPPYAQEPQLDDILNAYSLQNYEAINSAFPSGFEDFPEVRKQLIGVSKYLEHSFERTNWRMEVAHETYRGFYDDYVRAAEKSWYSARNPSAREFLAAVKSARVELEAEFKQVLDELRENHRLRGRNVIEMVSRTFRLEEASLESRKDDANASLDAVGKT